MAKNMNDYVMVEVYNLGQWSTVWRKKIQTQEKSKELEKIKNN